MTTFPLLVGLALGPVVGLLATVAMDRVMPRLPEGTTAPKVAAGVLTDTPVDAASTRLATWVHYAAGCGSGLLFVGLVAAVGAATGLGTAPTLAVGGTAMVALMVGFFALVPLPRARGLSRRRVVVVRRDWAIAAAVYVAVAAALVGVVAAF